MIILLPGVKKIVKNTLCSVIPPLRIPTVTADTTPSPSDTISAAGLKPISIPACDTNDNEARPSLHLMVTIGTIMIACMIEWQRGILMQIMKVDHMHPKKF
jgi:hypothetical protein